MRQSQLLGHEREGLWSGQARAGFRCGFRRAHTCRLIQGDLQLVLMIPHHGSGNTTIKALPSVKCGLSPPHLPRPDSALAQLCF